MTKRWLWVVLGVLAVFVFAQSSRSQGAAAGTNTGVRDQLIGAWRLVSLEEQSPDGKIRKLPRSGTLLYSRDGHMSVQIMAPEGKDAPETGPVAYEKGGYEAYFGTYVLDEKAATVTHHVEGALVRTLIGQDLTRVYRFSGKQLVLRSSRKDENWTIVWEHY